jgi:hypothetical protein
LVFFWWEIAISWRLENMFPAISISKLNTWLKVRYKPMCRKCIGKTAGKTEE